MVFSIVCSVHTETIVGKSIDYAAFDVPDHPRELKERERLHGNAVTHSSFYTLRAAPFLTIMRYGFIAQHTRLNHIHVPASTPSKQTILANSGL